MICTAPDRRGECYLLQNFVVREYGSKFVSMAKEGCEIMSIEDIGETVPNIEVLQEDCEELTDAEIVGIPLNFQFFLPTTHIYHFHFHRQLWRICIERIRHKKRY